MTPRLWWVPRGLILSAAFVLGLFVFLWFGGSRPDVWRVDQILVAAANHWAKNWAGGERFGAAAARHLGALGAAALVLATSWFAGASAGRWMRLGPAVRGRGAERLLAWAGLGTGLWALGIMGLGVTGLLGRGAVFVLGAGFVLAGLGCPGVRRRALPGRRLRARRPGLSLLWLLPLALLGMDLMASLSPEWFHDGRVYHLGLAERFLAAGKFAVYPEHLLTFLPLNAEMAYAAALALGGEEAAKALNLGWGALLVLAVATLAGRLAVRPGARPARGAGVMAALLYVSLSVTQIENEVAFGDNLRALFETLALLWVLKHPRSGRAALVAAGVFLGLAMGTKYLSVIRGVFLVAGLAAFRPLHPARPASGRRLGVAALFAGVAALALGPWLARNWLAGHDPVYPFGEAVFDSLRYSSAELARWMQDNRHYGVAGMTLPGWLALPYRVTFDQSGAFGTFTAGPLLLGLSLLLAGRRRWAFPAGAALALVAGEAVVWSLTSQLIRYLLPALAALCAVYAWLLAEVRREAPGFGRLFSGIVLLWVACSLGDRAHHRFNLDDAYGVLGHFTGRFSPEDARADRGFGADFRKLPSGVVLLVGEDRVLGIGRRWAGGSLYNVPLLKAWAEESDSSGRLGIKARQAGVRAVLVNVRGYREVEGRGEAFRLTGREWEVVNPWWKRLRVAYRSGEWVGYAVP